MTSQTDIRIPVHNSSYPKVAVQWLNQALCIYQSFCLVDSESLRNRHLRVAAKRYIKLSEKFIGKHSKNLQFCRSLEILVVFRNY